MAANTQKRGKSESLIRAISPSVLLLSVCAFIRPRGVSCRRSVVLKQSHPAFPSPEVMLPRHLISPE